jgi:hypothetical protein
MVMGHIDAQTQAYNQLSAALGEVSCDSFNMFVKKTNLAAAVVAVEIALVDLIHPPIPISSISMAKNTLKSHPLVVTEVVEAQ